jgi:hypothetical protein
MNELEALAKAINELPLPYQQQLTPVLGQLKENHRRRRSILQLVNDAMNQLRLDMKYLMFDLEATRRERDEYKTQLEK